MYYAHFGLSEPPFRITPNTEVFFAGAHRGAILDALIYAISQGEGIVKVTGEVGTGKTMLCNMLQSRLPPQIETVYLAHPSVSPEEILHAIAFELQLKVTRDANRMEVMQALYAYLLARHAEGRQVVIFIEESQNMPIATLEEVRLLSNLETGKHKLLQIVLFGQPELDDNLRQPHIRQLRERITHSFTLPPLGMQEVGEYLMFRMRAVGYRGPDVFNAGVVKRIAQGSAGLTRRINLIADKALLAAFSENTHTIQPRHVAAALRDSEFARDDAIADVGRKRLLAVLAGITLMVLIAAAFYLGPTARRMLNSDAGGPSGVRSELPREVPAPVRMAALDAALPGQVLDGPAPAPEAGGAKDPAQRAEIPVANPEPNRAVVSAQHAPAPGAAAGDRPDAWTPGQALDDKADVLTQRIRATRLWLDTEAPETHVIQLLGSENTQQLSDHLSTIAKSIEANNIYVYRTIAKQRPFLSVLYGSFRSREAALDALNRLPPHLKAFKPYPRTVQGIREEMSRNNTL